MRRNSLVIFLLFTLFAFSLAGEESFYIVKKGDTLQQVSRNFNIPVDILLAVNGINNTQTLELGRKLLIPAVYVVKKGDTLYSISRRYGVTVDDLLSLNKLLSPQSLKINQKLYIAAPKGNRDNGSGTLKTVFWPHPGKRELYDGKIKGILINGDKGDLVYSVSSGRVIEAGPYRGHGYVALVLGDDDLVYGYLGNDELMVSVNESIEAGSVIGRLGVYFHQTDAKLLFIIYHNIKRIFLDPQQVLTISR